MMNLTSIKPRTFTPTHASSSFPEKKVSFQGRHALLHKDKTKKTIYTKRAEDKIVLQKFVDLIKDAIGSNNRATRFINVDRRDMSSIRMTLEKNNKFVRAFINLDYNGSGAPGWLGLESPISRKDLLAQGYVYSDYTIEGNTMSAFDRQGKLQELKDMIYAADIYCKANNINNMACEDPECSSLMDDGQEDEAPIINNTINIDAEDVKIPVKEERKPIDLSTDPHCKTTIDVNKIENPFN